MTKYICKCGRVVQKSTNADNTGNRDTAGCEGCPYLLPWGPTQWDATRHAIVTDVKGHECRMSPTIEYTTTYHGRADDKCSLRIVSLDLDFLDEVQAWIYDHANETLRAGFSRGSMRGIEFSDKGRYSLSVLCAQNKRGIAAKASLLAEFFGPDKRRRDMTPEQEKAHILAAIEAGKARAQKKEDKALSYKDPATGWLYRVSPKPVNGEDVYGMEYLDPKNSTVWKPDVKWNTGAVYRDQGHLQEALEARARRDGWEPVEENVWKKNAKDAQRVGAAVTTETSAAANDVISPAIVTQTSAEKSPAPASHADAGAATQSLSAAEPASSAVQPSGSLAFDFSALGDLANQASEADAQFNLHYGRAHDEYLIACIYMARVHELTAKAGRYGGGTWTAWYQSKGISEGSARTMVQNGDGFKSATVADLKNLPALSKKDLNLIARQGAAGQVLDAAGHGDSERVQEIMAQLKAAQAAQAKAEQKVALASEREEKARAAAHHYHEQYEDAIDQRNRLLDEQGAYISRTTEAEERAKAAEAAAREAEKQRDGARDALQAAKLRGDQWQEKAEARQARIQELESRPIQTTAMDSDEVDRLVAQRMEEELARQAPRRQEEQEQAARDAYDAFILTARSLDNLWKALKPQISRLAPEQKSGAENLLLQKLMEVKEELIHACENCQP